MIMNIILIFITSKNNYNTYILYNKNVLYSLFEYKKMLINYQVFFHFNNNVLL